MIEEDFVDFLSEEARSDTAIFHTFVATYGEPNEIHVFFEGDEDSLFYSCHVRARANGRQIHKYVCGGKWPLIDTRNLIDPAVYHDVPCLFFIDRDYDDVLKRQAIIDDRTYLTDGYSIESEFATTHSAEVISCDLAGLTPADPEFQEFIGIVQNALREGEQHLLSLMAWSLSLREKGLKVNLNNVDLKKVLKIDERGVVTRKKDGFQKFKSATVSNVANPTVGEVRKWRRILEALPPPQRCRGKFALWVFETTLISCLPTLTARAKARGRKGVRVPAAVKERQTLTMLGGRLPPPKSLSDFLGKLL